MGVAVHKDAKCFRGGLALGRNQPLKRERPKWKSDYPMTEGQLRSKRDEFWDTAPAFEGRKEIWDALRAAASAILDGARALTECYDELGNRYQLPVYCLSPPVNMIEEHSEEPDGSDPDSGAADPSTGSASDQGSGGECQLRLRLSTGRDLRLAVRSSDTVGMMKRRLQSQEGVPSPTQRWFFSGRPLTDRLRLDQLNISRDYVVQVIPQPAATAGAAVNSRTHTRGPRAGGRGGSGCTAAGAHACGELTLLSLAPWRQEYQPV
uniref:Ubiquitin domain containing 2 n=1 Tax=Labrus bergylta TaxID=56723 RepID=A0A3Q3E767_9LABR